MVISMALKKLSSTRVMPMVRTEPARAQSLWARTVKTPAWRSPATTTIRA